MDERLKNLLRLVVEDVIETGEPVGSQRLVEEYELSVSPATIRNWFVELVEAGYLAQPHTSSGRLPTEDGYRFYLKELMEEYALRQQELQNLQRAAQAVRESTQRLKRLARIVSDMTDDSMVLAGHEAEAFSFGLSHLLTQPELSDREQVLSLGEALDRMEEVIHQLRRRHYATPTALIGQECPFGEDWSTVILTLDDGTLLGLLGPLRMNYSRSYALLKSARDLILE